VFAISVLTFAGLRIAGALASVRILNSTSEEFSYASGKVKGEARS
jgi:hypothetical protein